MLIDGHHHGTVGLGRFAKDKLRQAPQDTQGGRHLFFGHFDFHVQPADVLAGQLCGCTQRHQPPVLHDRHPVAQPLSFHQVMGAHEYRAAFPASHAFDQPIHMMGGYRVKPGGGFVKEEQLRLVQQGTRQCQALLHPFTVTTCFLIGAVA